MSFLTPVGNAPRKSASQSSQASSSTSFTSLRNRNTVFVPGSSKKFPATVWTLHGDAVSMSILGNFDGNVASMLKEQFVNSVFSHAAKVCPGFSKSPFIKHTTVSQRSFPCPHLHVLSVFKILCSPFLQIAIVTTQPAITEKFTLEFQVDEVIFAPVPKKLEWETKRSSTVRCSENLAQFFRQNLAVSDVMMITGGRLFCPGTNKWTEMILDLTGEKVKGPVSIVRLINTVRVKQFI